MFDDALTESHNNLATAVIASALAHITCITILILEPYFFATPRQPLHKTHQAEAIAETIVLPVLIPPRPPSLKVVHTTPEGPSAPPIESARTPLIADTVSDSIQPPDPF